MSSDIKMLDHRQSVEWRRRKIRTKFHALIKTCEALVCDRFHIRGKAYAKFKQRPPDQTIVFQPSSIVAAVWREEVLFNAIREGNVVGVSSEAYSVSCLFEKASSKIFLVVPATVDATSVKNVIEDLWSKKAEEGFAAEIDRRVGNGWGARFDYVKLRFFSFPVTDKVSGNTVKQLLRERVTNLGQGTSYATLINDGTELVIGIQETHSLGSYSSVVKDALGVLGQAPTRERCIVLGTPKNLLEKTA